MKQKPEISILMGTYNDHKIFAAQAIDSMLNQTFTDFEFIICDDGSDASYVRWLSEYCKKDPRIRLLRSRKNRGLGIVLNKCFSCASGKYIARMDADDISRPDRLEKQSNFLKEHKEYAFVGSCARLIAEHGVWGERRLEEIPQKTSFLKTSAFLHPTVMMRREVMERSGGYSQSKKFIRMEDYEFFMRLYAAGWRGCNLQETLLDYREDSQAYTKRKYRYRFYECRMRFLGFRKLGIWKGNMRYVIKPLVAGMIPRRIMQMIRGKKFAGNHFGKY